MEKLQSDRNAGIFLTSTDTKVQLKIVMQQPPMTDGYVLDILKNHYEKK